MFPRLIRWWRVILEIDFTNSVFLFILSFYYCLRLELKLGGPILGIDIFVNLVKGLFLR